MNRFRLLCTAFFTILFGTAAMSETAYVDVTVTYRERMALPPGAELQVEIRDVSRADAPSVLVAYERVPITTVPMTVRLGVDKDRIDDRLSYSVRGEIHSGDTVLFRSTTHTPVLTRDAPDKVDLLLMRAQAASEAAEPANPIAGIEWEAFELAGRMLIAEDLPTLTFDTDGRFGLYGGCNRYTGQAEIAEATVKFPTQMAGTRMACPPVRTKLENDVLKALADASGFVRNGDLLTLTNATGVATIRLRARQD